MGYWEDFLNNVSQAPKNIWNTLEGKAQNVAQDIGAGIAANQNPATQQSADLATQMAQKAFNKSLTTTDPVEKANLQKVAQQGLNVVGQGAQTISSGFSPDVTQNPLKRGLTAGAQVVTGAQLGAQGVDLAASLATNPIGTITAAVKLPFQIVSGAGNAIKALQSMGPDDLANLLKQSPQMVADFIKSDWERSFKLPQTPPAVPSAVPTEGTPLTKSPAELNSNTAMGNTMLRQQYNNSPAVERNFTQVHLNQLADYGQTTPKQVINSAKIVSDGETGIGPKLVRKVIAQASPVDIGEIPSTTPGVAPQPAISDVAQNIVDNTYGISPTDEQKFIKNTAVKLANDVPNAPTANINAPAPGAPNATIQLKKDPSSFYDFMVSIQKQGANLSKSADPARKALGEAYYQFFNELEDRLYINSGANKILSNTVLTPEEIKALNGVSPKLTADVNNALQNGTVGQLRNLLQPFVTGSKAAEETLNNPKSPLNLRSMIGIYAAAHGNIAAALPALEEIPAVQNATGKMFRAIGGTPGGGLPPTPPSLGNLAPTAASLGIQSAINKPKPSPVPTPPPTGTNIAAPNGMINIPQSKTDIKPNPDGSYTVLDPTQLPFNGKPLAAPTAELGATADNLRQQQAIAEANYKYSGSKDDLNKLNTINSNLADVTAMQTRSEKLIGSQQLTQTGINSAEQTKQLLKTVSPNFFSLYKSFDQLRQAADPQYSQLISALTDIDASYPGAADQILKARSFDVALQAVNQAEINILDKHNQVIRSYMGTTSKAPVSATPPATYSSQLPIPPESNPEVPSGFWMPPKPGGGGAGLPPLPKQHNLPPLSIPRRYQYR